MTAMITLEEISFEEESATWPYRDRSSLVGHGNTIAQLDSCLAVLKFMTDNLTYSLVERLLSVIKEVSVECL